MRETIRAAGGVMLPMGKLEPYDKHADYSYCLGIYPSLKLLESRPQSVRRLLLHPAGLSGDGIEKLREQCAALGIREESAERILKREAKKDNCFAALVFGKYPAALNAHAPHVVLHRISDGGNLGTILRACLGFGLVDVAVIRPCVDVFDPHVLRASMGAFFGMRVQVFDSFDAYRAVFTDHALYPFMLRGGKPLGEIKQHHAPNYALLFGNEATGLPDAFAELGQPVFIEQSDAIDSLNLAVSVAIGVYAFQREGRRS